MSSAERFQRCHAVTARWEGGWSDHPADPGGKTMYGITEAVYHTWQDAQGIPRTPVRDIPRLTAELIYFDNYWKPCGGPTLHAGVDLATYDASVNSGVSRGRKWLLASIGGTAVQTVKGICAKRLSFVRGLANWVRFGNGWLNRITDVEAKGVSWAAGENAPAIVAAERDSASNKATSSASGSAVSGGGTAATGANGGESVEAIVILIVIGLAVTVFLLWQAYKNRKRRAAYAAELRKLPT